MLGLCDGDELGPDVGSFDGDPVCGAADGPLLGLSDGEWVGLDEVVGLNEGCVDGDVVGKDVGEGVTLTEVLVEVDDVVVSVGCV